jgi:hypothetical protein
MGVLFGIFKKTGLQYLITIEYTFNLLISLRSIEEVKEKRKEGKGEAKKSYPAHFSNPDFGKRIGHPPRKMPLFLKHQFS